eukprot:GFUD01020698.1.p1 GENE.GFUD01020698.1~~GFUD01020698.1.p1  ORF type:complete len:558 (+),score=90.32 GFUD01020698.1:200-1873(+)
MLAILLFMLRGCDSRLFIASSTDTRTLIKSGGEAMFWCETNKPWFLCVWKGPAGLAITKTQGQANGDCIESPDPRISLTGSGNICRLSINRIQTRDAGDYSCVLADKEDVQTVTRNIQLEVGVGAAVNWVQGSSISYFEGGKVNLTCQSEGGHPRPSLVIRSIGNVDLKEEPSVAEGALVSRSVSIDGLAGQNNTMLTCQAEQRGLNGVLLYNSTLAIIRLDVLSQLLLVCLDWWCGWETLIFILLVVGLFLLVACCGMYFFFATRGTPYNVIMYDSENKASQQHLIGKPEKPLGIPEPMFISDRDSLNETEHDLSFDQVESVKQQIFDMNSNKETLERQDISWKTQQDMNHVYSNSSNIHANTNQNDVSLNNSLISKDVTSNNFAMQENSNNILNSTMDGENDTTLDGTIISGTQAGGFLIETEEMSSYKTTTQTTIEERYRRKKKQNDSLSEFSDDSSLGEEIVNYPLHQYHLQDCQNIKRLGRSYSKIIKDHLNQNPSIAVSETSIAFKVARPKSRATQGERSCQSSPFLGSKFKHEEIREKSEYMQREETHFN